MVEDSYYDTKDEKYIPLWKKDEINECRLWHCKNKQYKKNLCRKHYRTRYVLNQSIGNPWNGPDEEGL